MAKYSSMGEQTKPGSIHTMELCSAIKRNGMWIQVTTCMNLKDTMLSKRSQSQNVKHCINSFMKSSRKDKTFGIDNRSVGFPGCSVVKNPSVNVGDTGLIPGSQRSPGEGNGNPLWDSYLGNPMDRGTWWATWGHKE